MPPRRGHGRRCARCRLLVDACLCRELPTIITQTRVVVVSHVAELLRTTNTAQLAQLMLPELVLCPRGHKDRAAAALPATSASTRTALLYPEDGAPELTTAWAHLDPRPLTLVIADGSWPQARRAARREPALAPLPRLRLPDGAPTRFWLREATRSSQHLCTLEAIARALGIIEGHRVEAALLAGLGLFVRRTLAARGRLSGPQALTAALEDP